MDTNAFAEKVHADGKTVRKFLRATTPKDEQPGRGHRWELPNRKRDLQKLTIRYEKWAELHTRHSTGK
jgi:hypothetical protein